MSQCEYHVMDAALIEDRLTTRYTCPICQRCVEDGPEGITMIHRGDQSALHRGGSLVLSDQEIEQAPPPSFH